MSPDVLTIDRRRQRSAGPRPSVDGIGHNAVDSEVVAQPAWTMQPATHWPALDGLRGIAVAGVVAYHLGWISGGFLGVDLFFTLSGYLITTLLIREHRGTGHVDLIAFWGRRFRRLLPAVMALVVGVLAWCAVFGTPAEQAGARGDARWAIPYLANWHLVSASRDYWASAIDASVFTHLWSLAIEEQFYLVWPVVAWWALRGRRGEHRLAGVTAVGFVASALAMVLLYDTSSPSRVYLGTDTRALALFIGALVALDPVQRFLRTAVTRRPFVLRAVGPTIAVLLAISWLIGGEHLDLLLRGGLIAHSVLAALLVGLIALSSGTPTLTNRVLERRALIWVGTRSYGIYLWHWPVIVLAEPRWTVLPAPVRDLAMIALSLALAETSFRALEQPVRRRLGWASHTRATWATGIVTCAAIAMTIVAPSGRGHVAGFEVTSVAAPGLAPAEPADASAQPSADTVAPEPVAERATPTAAGATSAAERGAAVTAVPDPVAAVVVSAARVAQGAAAMAEGSIAQRHLVSRVLWIGDSVAADLAPALTAAFAASGVTLIDGSGDGLRLTPGGGVDPIDVYSKMLAEETFDSVVVQLSYWDSPADLDQLRTSLGWFRDRVRERGAELVVLTPPPVRDDLVDPGLARQIEVVGQLVTEGQGRVHLVDTAPAWGAAMALDIDGDGAPDRKPDGVHVCPQGAARFAAWLTADLGARFRGMSPQPTEVWAAGDWSTSIRYDTPAGACVALG